MAVAARRGRAGGSRRVVPEAGGPGRAGWSLVAGTRTCFLGLGLGSRALSCPRRLSRFRSQLMSGVCLPDPASRGPRAAAALVPHGDLSSGSHRARLHAAPRRVLNQFRPTDLSPGPREVCWLLGSAFLNAQNNLHRISEETLPLERELAECKKKKASLRDRGHMTLE